VFLCFLLVFWIRSCIGLLIVCFVSHCNLGLLPNS
jgi:hypothetical protein